MLQYICTRLYIQHVLEHFVICIPVLMYSFWIISSSNLRPLLYSQCITQLHNIFLLKK
uniref:Uncharacterized protein n=1 Tax=Anguilla anguilla TaxID=7936 RepID=A0A0E9RQ96_ANGAN